MSDEPPRSSVVHIEIDIDKLQQIGRRGVYRAAAFMGFGLNAAARPDFNEFSLAPIAQGLRCPSIPVDFFPRELNGEQASKMKQNFSDWVIACGLREILEYYGQMLDKMHYFCILVENSARGPIKSDKTFPELRKFINSGLAGKLHTLKSFDVFTENEDCVIALYKTRNAYSHGLATVRQRDTTRGEKLCLRWLAIEMWGTGTETGADTPLNALIGERLGEEITVNLKSVWREKT